MSAKLKPITESAWLVISDTDDSRIGLLTEIKNQYVLILKGEKQQFLNRKEVSEFFHDDIFNNVIEPTPTIDVNKVQYIGGYPVDSECPIEIFIPGKNLPMFSKKEFSEVIYSAGYYCIDFPRNTVSSFCPKLSTLESYPYVGPLKSELEMKTELTRRRKLRNISIQNQ